MISKSWMIFLLYTMHFCQNFYIIFSSHSCGCNTCTHVSNGALLTELFNFYYASRASAIKIILFWKFCLKKNPNNSWLSGWAHNTAKTCDTTVTGAVWPWVWKSVPVLIPLWPMTVTPRFYPHLCYTLYVASLAWYHIQGYCMILHGLKSHLSYINQYFKPKIFGFQSFFLGPMTRLTNQRPVTYSDPCTPLYNWVHGQYTTLIHRSGGTCKQWLWEKPTWGHVLSWEMPEFQVLLFPTTFR